MISKSKKNNNNDRAAICAIVLFVLTLIIILLKLLLFQGNIREIVDFPLVTDLHRWRQNNVWATIVFGVVALIVSSVALFTSTRKKPNNELKKTTAIIMALLGHIVVLLIASIFFFPRLHENYGLMVALVWFNLRRLGVITTVHLIVVIATIVRVIKR